jgi:hypothetical protein
MRGEASQSLDVAGCQGPSLRNGAPGARGRAREIIFEGKEAVLVIDPGRFEVRPKKPEERTMADFIERSKKYRGPLKLLQE